jgi:hypothetical protein
MPKDSNQFLLAGQKEVIFLPYTILNYIPTTLLSVYACPHSSFLSSDNLIIFVSVVPSLYYQLNVLAVP